MISALPVQTRFTAPAIFRHAARTPAREAWRHGHRQLARPHGLPRWPDLRGADVRLIAPTTPAPTYPRGRRCTHVDESGVRCITMLCRHNPGPDCFIHSAPVAISKHEAREAFAELMAELPRAA